MTLSPQAYIKVHQDRFLEELMAFLRIPSVGTEQKYAENTRSAAHFIQQQLSEAGADRAELLETTAYPLVYAEKVIDKSLPTVLFYGHYDVQPPDPYELWDHPPFEPTVEAGKIYARGASDDKGQVYLHIKALETMLATEQLPCNIKFLIEGEEENGSAGLAHFLDKEQNLALLQADAILVSDTALLSPDQPSLITGMRGIVAFEIEVTGPNRDLHSGSYGGAVGNPINILCQMIGALQDEQQRITIPGFYDQVVTPSAELRAELAKLPFDLEEYQQMLGIETVIGEKGYSTLERTSIRPSLDVNGIWGGYTGKGAKTVLPAKAYAKLSMRLVPHQDARQVMEQFTTYLTAVAPQGVCVTIKPHQGCEAAVFNTDSLAIKAASKAFEKIWKQKPIMTREGGSIPILAKLQQILHCDVAMMGFGLGSDAAHAPNEHFVLAHFYKGMEAVMAFYDEFAALHTSQ